MLTKRVNLDAADAERLALSPPSLALSARETRGGIKKQEAN